MNYGNVSELTARNETNKSTYAHVECQRDEHGLGSEDDERLRDDADRGLLQRLASLFDRGEVAVVTGVLAELLRAGLKDDRPIYK